MKIELEYPFSTMWKRGYLVTNNENRKNVILYNSQKDRSTVSYARYLMSVSLKRFLTEDEHVDHKDDDKTHDYLGNLQILTQQKNAEKEGKRRGKQLAKICCPICTKTFMRRKGLTQAVKSLSGKVTCCTKTCSNEFIRLKKTPDERKKISEETLLGIFLINE